MWNCNRNSSIFVQENAFENAICEMAAFLSRFQYANWDHLCDVILRSASYPRKRDSWGQHGAHQGPVGPRWAPCGPLEPCYQGRHGLFSLHHDINDNDRVLSWFIQDGLIGKRYAWRMQMAHTQIKRYIHIIWSKLIRNQTKADMHCRPCYVSVLEWK